MAIFKLVDLAILGPSAILTAFLSVRLGLGCRSIKGLTSYVPTQESLQSTDTAQKKQQRGSTKAKETADTSSLLMVPLNQATVVQLPEYSSLETLIYSTLLMGIVFAAYSTVAYFGLAPYGTASLLLNASVFLMSLVSLLAVSLLSQMTSAEDKIYCILYSSLGFIGAVAYFAMEPEGVFLWSPEGGAQAAASLLKSVVQNALARSNMDSHPLIDNIEAPLSLLGIIFAVLAAFMTAVLHGSALRFARTFHSHTSPPVWAKQYMESMFLDTLRLRIQMVAPMFLPVLYMNLPMDEILGLQADTIMLVQSAALVATGILFIINSRIVVARYLETAFIAWYTVKHGQHRNKVEKTAAYTILKAKADIVRYTSCKTAIQAIAPGVLYLSCGLLSLGSYLYMMTSPDDGNIADYTSQFVQNAVGFVVTFVGALWFIVCGFSLWLFRTGTVIY